MADARREDEPQIFDIDDPDVGENLSSDWGFGNQLVVFGSSLRDVANAAKGSSRPKTLARRSNLLHQIQWNTTLHSEHARKLVSESNSIFVALQKLSSSADPGGDAVAVNNQLIKISRQYRSIVTAFVDDLQNTADASIDEALRADLEMQSQSFFKIELIWNLCEILFVDVQPSGALLIQLLDWIRLHFPQCESLAREAALSADPASHDSYWPAVYSYVMQGRINDVRRLLYLHPESRSPAFVLVDQLLRKMPLYSYFTEATSYDFVFQWQQWNEECIQRSKRGEFLEFPQLDKVCNLLCGKMDTFLEMSDLCETWYHLMVSRLLYTDPCVKATDLQSLAHDYVDVFGGLTQMSDLDNVLLAALEFDVLEAVRLSSESFRDWWFAAHLTDLLYRSGCGQKQSQSRSRDASWQLREFLLLEYAASLASHPSMWQFAVDYLDHCPAAGRDTLEACLERVPVETDYAAARVVHLARQRDMEQLALSVCRVKAQQALKNNRLGSALSWALKSKDSAFVTFLADRLLTEYGSQGRFHDLALLDNIGPSMLVSDRLAFLCKYREFHQLYGDKKFHRAANILIPLLTSKLAPKTFWKPLLLDAIPLLESDEVVFSTEQTYELLHCLEETEISSSASSSASGEYPGQRDSEMEESTREQMIRLALARNLARTFTSEDPPLLLLQGAR